MIIFFLVEMSSVLGARMLPDSDIVTMSRGDIYLSGSVLNCKKHEKPHRTGLISIQTIFKRGYFHCPAKDILG